MQHQPFLVAHMDTEEFDRQKRCIFVKKSTLKQFLIGLMFLRSEK